MTMKTPACIKKIISEKEMAKTFLIFYAVGFLLFCIPYTRSFFFSITPVSILLVVAALFWHHQKWNKSTIVVFSIIAVGSYLLEVAGVATGNLFGNYSYGATLGFRIFHVPLLIGLNWVYLIYASQAIMIKITRHVYLRIVGGATLMVAYDAVIECAAPPMQMWSFASSYPPIQNFVVWFLASLVFHSLLVICHVPVENKAARALFGIQFLFFNLITLYSVWLIR
jgi:uncharacterized membrane protein